MCVESLWLEMSRAQSAWRTFHQFSAKLTFDACLYLFLILEWPFY